MDSVNSDVIEVVTKTNESHGTDIFLVISKLVFDTINQNIVIIKNIRVNS